MFKFLFILLISLQLNHVACYAKDIFVTINIGDCIKSLNNLNNLSKLEDTYEKLFFVFPTDRKEDSLLIQDYLNLYRFKGEYIFSDSIYSQLSIGGQSTITFVDKDTVKHKQLLATFDGRLSIEINKDLNSVDTLYLSRRLYKGDIKQNIYNIDNAIVIPYELRNMLQIYDDVSGEFLFQVSLSDTLLAKKLYEKHVENNIPYEENSRLLKGIGIKHILKMEGFYKNKDTIYILAALHYASGKNGQTGNNMDLKKEYGLMKFIAEKFESYHTISFESLLNQMNFFPFISSIYCNNNELLVPIIHRRHSNDSAQILAKFIFDNKEYKFNRLVDNKVDLQQFDNNLSCNRTFVYDNKHIIAHCSNVLIDLSTFKELKLPLFKTTNKFSATTIPYFIQSLKVDESHIWILKHDAEDNKLHFIKINKKDLNVVGDIAFEFNVQSDKYTISDENPNILFKLLGNDRILKLEVFK